MASVPSKDQRIETLARTLRTSGFALSDSQAKKMAQDMLDTEDRVQKRYQVQHEKAESILRGGPPAETPLPKAVDAQQLKEHMVEEMRERALGSPQEHKEHTDNEFAHKTVASIVEEAKPVPEPVMVRSQETREVLEELAPLDPTPAITPLSPITPTIPIEPQEPEAEPQEPAEPPAEEEDPNQPEKTVVYSDKPKNPKPKEEFEENKIDLSDIFKARK